MRKKKLSCLDILRVDERSITGEVESLKLWFLRWTHSKKSELDDVAEDPRSVFVYVPNQWTETSEKNTV